MSQNIDFENYAANLTIGDFSVHVQPVEVDGLPSLGIRVIFDDEEQRERFIRENLLEMEDHPEDLIRRLRGRA